MVGVVVRECKRGFLSTPGLYNFLVRLKYDIDEFKMLLPPGILQEKSYPFFNKPTRPKSGDFFIIDTVTC